MPSASIVNERFAPFSYADHADRIKNILKYDEYIPEEFVKLPQIETENYYYYESCSFADNKEMLEKKLNCSNISEEDVKITMIDGYGWTFYVKNSSIEAVVNCPFVRYDGSISMEIISKEELLQSAKDQVKAYNEELEAKAKWEAEHPGEIWSYTGYSSVFSDFISPKDVTAPENNSGTTIVEISIILGISLAVAAAAVAACVRNRRKETAAE